MADDAIFIGWGPVITGREQKAPDVFNEVVQFWGQKQQQGEVEGFDAFFLEPHGGDLAGFLIVRGDAQKLSQIRASDEFIRQTNRGQAVVQNFGVVTAFTGDRLNQLFQKYIPDISDVIS
jgi:hypothetical protein